MRDLNYELKKLCQRNCDGSYATQYARERVLTLVARYDSKGARALPVGPSSEPASRAANGLGTRGGYT